MHANRACQRFTVRSNNRLLPGSINLSEQQPIRLRQRLDEILEQITGTTESMRLKGKQQPASRKSASSGSQGCHDFRRVMAVVVDQRKNATARQIDFSIMLKTPLHATKFGKCSGNGGIAYVQFVSNRNCRQRILHVMQTWQIERYRQSTCGAIDTEMRHEMHFAVIGTYFCGIYLCLVRQSIGCHRLSDHWNDFTHMRIID